MMAMARTEKSDDAGIDPQLWHACAGGMVQLPYSASPVIYFPQGHIEQAASPPDIPPSLKLPSIIPCTVTSVKFLADKDTDEVYARIRLQPESGRDLAQDSSPTPPPPFDKPLSFVKTLTQSDANNGGGFSVPRYCAETIFPRLDYSADPPVQTVLAKDVHGDVWKFRHIYRGTPRRHLLTTGWSTFVNQKKLVAGDAIVFLRSSTGDLCVGVRRSTKSSSYGDSCAWHLSGARPSRWAPTGQDAPSDFLAHVDNGFDRLTASRDGRSSNSTPTNFSRNRTRVTAKSVLEALTLAAAGQPFEVVYYPRASISEFCVKAHAVKAASQQNWIPGMRFKMAFETEDSSRISWFMGSILKVNEADPALWPNSPWKMLQVSWDEPELLQGITRVSPWQVELVSRMQLPPFTLPKKKPRISQHSEIQQEGQDIVQLNQTAVTNNLFGPYNSLHRFMDSLPSGMQGARHDQNYGIAVRPFKPNIQPGLFMDGFYQHADRLEYGMGHTLTDSNKGNCFPTECITRVQNNFPALFRVGPPSDNEPASSTTALSCAGSSNTKSTTFMLFGKAINTEQAVKTQQQLSGGSYSDGPGPDSASDGNLPEVPERCHTIFSGQGKPADAFDSWHHGESLDSSSNEIGSLNWFKEQAILLDKVKGVEGTMTNCKVFREDEETGHTLILSLFNSYEDLYGKLSKIFSIEESEISNRLVYMDFEGFLRQIGKEPYRDFMKKAKWMKVLSEASSENMT